MFHKIHNNSYKLYHIGEVAKDTIRDFAQFGRLDDLIREGEEEVKVYDQFSTPAVGRGTGETKNLVLVDGDHSLVSLISRIVPSPDWFIGVDSLNLCVDSAWVDQITLDLQPLDAGAASGLTFTAPRWKTIPPEPVTKHGPKKPNHPAAGFYYPDLKELPTIATVEFVKMEEYSTKDLNLLAKQKLITLLKLKDKKKGYPMKTVTEDAVDELTTKSDINKSEDTKISQDSKSDDDTKGDLDTELDTLEALEEEPFGTPRPNLPDNNVLVVTKATTTTTTENEFDNNLENMDDVVLAVARGRRLGLGKHLPRHFRSRLHHAVNRIQPNDCLVSKWSEWTPCSVTCGFGDKFRSRTVLREKKEGGRDCPTLSDRKHCGNVNSCAHIDYFEW